MNVYAMPQNFFSQKQETGVDSKLCHTALLCPHDCSQRCDFFVVRVEKLNLYPKSIAAHDNNALGLSTCILTSFDLVIFVKQFVCYMVKCLGQQFFSDMS